MEDKLGTAGQFIYDLNCILDSRKGKFDIVLQLGYTSSSVWGGLLPKKPVVITNMDGLEWMRSKFSKKVQFFLKRAEKWAINTSDHLVADSVGIQQHLKTNFNVDSTYIPYGAHVFNSENKSVLKNYNLQEHKYHMLIARMEPENNVETILDGYDQSKSDEPFLVVGKTTNEFGKYLVSKFQHNKNIQFLGGIYDIEILNNLRFYANLYFHGHSVGGTNPSLLEAMSSGALIAANDNIFNKSILETEAFYFSNSADVSELILKGEKTSRDEYVSKNIEKIKTLYTWNKIIEDYENLFIKLAKL
jgi:glycosyltransferase involved in cell wall biosynthesis